MIAELAEPLSVGLAVWVFTYGLNRVWLGFKRFVN